MERAGLYAVSTQLLQAAAQLAGRASGERNREHRRRVVNASGNAIRDPVGDRSRLAGAGSGDHRHWSVQRGRDLSLLRVKIIQQRVRRDR